MLEEIIEKWKKIYIIFNNLGHNLFLFYLDDNI